MQVYLRQKDIRKALQIPALFRLIRHDKVVSVCVVHVDDLQVPGKPADVTPTLKSLAKKVKLQFDCPFLTEADCQNSFSHSTSSVRFLKPQYSFEDSKYVATSLENLGLEKRKKKNIPAPGNVPEIDNSKELKEKDAIIFLYMLGKIDLMFNLQ